jgi:hypothetical protein
MHSRLNFIYITLNLIPFDNHNNIEHFKFLCLLPPKCQVQVEGPATKSHRAVWPSLSHTSEAVIDEYGVLGRNDELQG